ncbi:MAG: gamma-glutamyl-gamma-aminobutyrate hydrolase family protein [candidate division NC10 bacterium]|nr:gamma-glutamyl-gamma-aminobutyrate hydrolase family protein [candidate division NC10 bacterium]MDE2320488.1 gamma-glutamyl-gamma-aminobutyrate hydrolase family protein [candidate division NC10 bacterium]
MRPKIGITSWHHWDDDERWEAILEAYPRAVLQAGGLPLILPSSHAETAPSPVEGPALAEAYLDAIDGLLLTGGADIHPSFYGQIVLERCGEIDEERDRFEVELVHAARSRDLPLLGICRGLQVLNVAMGGSLYQDLSYRKETDPAHQSLRERRGEPAHQVTIVEGSRLAGILEIRELRVTSTHHQIIRDLAPGLAVNAVAPDGVVEGVEGTGRFLLAVHWHPERMFTHYPKQLTLFRALVDEAAKARHR